MTRWPEKVDELLREAQVAGMAYGEAYRKLKAGTLGDLSPQPMPERTFTLRWKKAKDALRLAARGSAYDGPGFLDFVRLRLAVEAKRVTLFWDR